MTIRKYTSRSQQTTLSSLATSGATVLPVVAATTLLGGLSASSISPTNTFTIVIDPDTSLEEIVDITGVSANNLTVTRGVDGSSAVDHASGAVIRHMIIGRDLRDANLHEEATTYYTDGSGASHTLHGLSTTDGSVMGTTATQVVTNKDLSSVTNTMPATVATLTGVQTLTNKTLTAPTINGGTVTTATVTSSTLTSATLGSGLAAGGFGITNLATPVGTADAATKGYVDTAISNLIGAAPSYLNTLAAIDTAINNDASVYNTLVTSIGTKLGLAGGTMTGAINMGAQKITQSCYTHCIY